jgi:tetratricopeptide (TPR) repeat protein
MHQSERRGLDSFGAAETTGSRRFHGVLVSGHEAGGHMTDKHSTRHPTRISVRHLTGVLLPTFVVLGLLAPRPVLAGDRAEAQQLALMGAKLSASAAQDLETALAKDPEDLAARTELIGYYWHRALTSTASRQPLQQHVLWIVEHHPEAAIGGLPEAQLSPFQDGKAYEDAARGWRQAAVDHASDPAVLWNCAAFFLLSDRPFSAELLKKGEVLDPRSPEWPRQLGRLYRFESSRGSREEKQRAATQALAEYERAYGLTPGEHERDYLLEKLAKTAFDAGTFAKAESYARQALGAAQRGPRDWNTGNAVHDGHVVLGRLALHEGKLADAEKELLAAGKTPGSPQLDSFGPNMTLAEELLEKGRKDAVLQYFQLCSGFWKMGKDKLAAWSAAVERGEIPDFGANLYY